MRIVFFVLLLAASLNAQVMLDDVLLDRVEIAASNGMLRLSQLRGMNLPKSVDQTRKFEVIVNDSRGTRLGKYSAYAQAPNTKRSWLFGNFRLEGESSLKLSPGSYVMEFHADGNPFDRFAFEIAEHVSKDGRKRMIRNGAWNDLALLHFDDQARRPELSFVFWMRDLLEGTGVRPDNTGKYVAKIVREKDGKILGWSNKNGSSSIYPRKSWSRQQILFQDASKPERLQLSTVTAQEGAYHVELEYEGKVYGKYRFRVEGGKLVGLEEYGGEKIGSDGTVTWMTRK